MNDSNTNLFWVVLYRTMQASFESVPSLLCGLVIAGILRGMIGGHAIRRFFTDDVKIGAVRAWAIGLFIPVCSLGVLPVAWELRRVGVPRATVLTFLLAAPLADPFSIVSAFQQLEPRGTIALAELFLCFLGTFVVTAGTGILLGHALPTSSEAYSGPPLPASGLRRVGIASLTAARGLTTVLLPIVVIGLIGSGLLGLIPHGALERAVKDRSILAPLHMVAVAIPYYVSPQAATAPLCDLLSGGSTLGIAFAFLQLGIGWNTGTFLWIGRTFGLVTMVFTALMTVTAVTAIVYAFPLKASTLEIKGNADTRFFEIEPTGGIRTARQRAIRSTLTDDAGDTQWPLAVACAVLGILAIAGVVSHGFGEYGTITYWMNRRASAMTESNSRINRTLNASQLAAAGTATILAAATTGLYIYYPPPDVVLNRIEDTQLELALMIKSDPIPRQVSTDLSAQLRRWQRKIAMSTFLRYGTISRRLREANAELTVALNSFRAELPQGSREELEPLSLNIRIAATKCRDAL